MDRCSWFHNCAICTMATLCDTFEETCPWRNAEQYDLDAVTSGCLCLPCLDKLMREEHAKMEAMMRQINNDDEQDGA
jgi:hypothetical protein